MERYDYRGAVREDTRRYIRDEGLTFEDRDDFLGRMNEIAWVADSVTGNASGSYTFSRWRAEEYLCHNTDLLVEAFEAFGGVPGISDPECCDVTIRCYVLDECIGDVADEMFGEDDG